MHNVCIQIYSLFKNFSILYYYIWRMIMTMITGWRSFDTVRWVKTQKIVPWLKNRYWWGFLWFFIIYCWPRVIESWNLGSKQKSHMSDGFCLQNADLCWFCWVIKNFSPGMSAYEIYPLDYEYRLYWGLERGVFYSLHIIQGLSGWRKENGRCWRKMEKCQYVAKSS